MVTRGSFCRQLVGTCRKLAQSCRPDWEIPQNWAFSTGLEKAKGRLLAVGLALQNWEKAYKLKNSATRGARSVRYVYLSKRPKKASEFLAELMEIFSLPNCVIKCGWNYCYLKYEDSNIKLQGTWKIKKIWPHQKTHNNFLKTDPKEMEICDIPPEKNLKQLFLEISMSYKKIQKDN